MWLEDITGEQLAAIHKLRAEGKTIGEISVHPDVNWPERNSLELLERLAGPIPKRTVGELMPRGPVFKSRVGNLYAGKW